MSFSNSFQGLLRELVALVGEREVQEVEVERRLFGGWRIRVSRRGSDAPVYGPVQAAGPAPHAAPQPEETGPAGEADTSGLHKVMSPMVGMFYRAASPDAQPFVEEGDTVTTGQTLCIIEAMKIMNEIESDAAGRVVRVLVENGSPVEYNTPLFLIEPQ